MVSFIIDIYFHILIVIRWWSLQPLSLLEVDGSYWFFQRQAHWSSKHNLNYNKYILLINKFSLLKRSMPISVPSIASRKNSPPLPPPVSVLVGLG
jgi:hypothetical protein